MEGMIAGVLLFVAGLAVGGGGVWYLTQRFEQERMVLNRIIGQLQQEVNAHELKIPKEEL
jgi:hypothetical protein